jgi:hypothetical protein
MDDASRLTEDNVQLQRELYAAKSRMSHLEDTVKRLEASLRARTASA